MKAHQTMVHSFVHPVLCIDKTARRNSFLLSSLAYVLDLSAVRLFWRWHQVPQALALRWLRRWAES
jgi:hypothetical protein